ncbi:uncharacterized protein LOC100677964 [Nasonia vitripennis]|uniref:Uncharacterized protein n=1 Tax=Nasonia vitripennis TaxID=7425 RepID=A0A7M7QRI1_NASVI|nr:uncharacterized protein LOC100677964 [Nasonia vitripennis]
MQNPKSTKHKNRQDTPTDSPNETENEIRARLERLCKCDRILSDSEIADFGKFDTDEEDVAVSSDECDEDLVAERLKLRRLLDLPEDTHSLTKIETHLPPCLKYSFRSGLTHLNMQKFSPLTRGYQGSAVAVAAIATSHLIKPHCWNEPVIDQVIEDGDTYYSDSYSQIETDDRRTLKLLDLKRELDIRKTHRVSVKIDEPIFAGTFRSETPKDLHIAKALDLFFKKYTTCVLTSPAQNVAIWKCSKYFNFFDGQARLENCEIADPGANNGFAKLILLQSISDVLFVILEKSNVKNEPFVLYNIDIVGVRKLSELPDAEEKTLGEPKPRPSGYRIQDKYRAVVQGSYHLLHPILPEEFQGRGHLVLAVAALVYSRLLSGSKWTKVMIDLIFNQSNIYLTDLARVLGKTLDHTFELTVNDLLCDVVLGVYTAKIKVQENVVPGQGKKGKLTMDTGIRDYFAAHPFGILEIKKIFYPIWKERNKFYMLDPFACDEEGFRIDSRDPANAERYKKAAACVTMNSSVNQLVETILENTESKEKDPFIIHGLKVLYIKTGTAQDGSDEKVVFREKKTNRRPPRPPSPPSAVIDDCEVIIDSLPRPREVDKPVNEVVQYPQLTNQVELFMKTFDDEKSADPDDENVYDNQEIKLSGYKIINPHRLMLRGTKNCLSEEFSEQSRGRQGLTIALTALAASEQTDLAEWNSSDIDNIIYDGHSIYEEIVSCIHRGSSDGASEEDAVSKEYIGGGKKGVQIEGGSNNEESYEEFETLSTKGPEDLTLSMLPKNIKIGDTDVNLVWKMNVMKGEANPLANLGEALEKYFEQFDRVILENNELMYAIWTKYDKFFILNPYGNDQDGWQNYSEPAGLFVVDRIIELVNLLYGLIQYNEYNFILHFIKLSLPSSGEDNESSSNSEDIQIEAIQKYKTKFLPVTDADLAEIKITDEEVEQPNEDNLTNVLENEDNNSESKTYNLDEVSMNTRVFREAINAEKNLLKLFKIVAEPKQVDAPARLNLALVTGVVKIEHITEEKKQEENLDVFYEKLKYTHPPPFVLPPKKNLCALLDVKLASKSVQSLLSRFSIDSKLAIKEKTDLPLSGQQDATISLDDTIEKSKLITLPPKKYFFSKSLPCGLTPIRAINEQFIRDKIIDEEQEEDCRRKKKAKEIIMVPDDKSNVSEEHILPKIIPLGPCIKTPEPVRKIHDCPERKKRKCSLTAKEKEDAILKKLVCSTENLLFEMMFPDFKENIETLAPTADHLSVESADDDTEDSLSTISPEPEPCGFKPTADANIGIINANTCLEDRAALEDSHYKSCYFAAILAILAKINVSVNEFRSGVLDRFIRAASKIGDGTGKLRYKMTRWFRNFNILGVKYNVVLKQTRYADPENYEPDALRIVLESFLQRHQTGIVVFGNAAYAFWFANDMFYLFDPYACDENGLANADGSACLMQICDFDSFVERIIRNTGEAAQKPYRLYTVSIAHLKAQIKKKRKTKKKRVKTCKKQLEEEQREAEEVKSIELEQSESEKSLIELTDWVNKDKGKILPPDPLIPGFLPIKNYNASALEVEILENEITRSVLPPLKEDSPGEQTRQTPYDRTFYSNSMMSEPMDLCVMAWSQIYDPPVWSTKTIQALFEASKEYALDSLLASEDSTLPRMTDNLLTEFNIANYSFRVVFAPMHSGTLYANEGWNLATTLDRIFQSPVYTGVVLVCGNAHVGVMKKGERLYAWWLLKGTKKIRIIVSEDMEDYLKLIVKEINQPGESEFSVRIVTISYAKILGPNCSDIEGLHESMMPSTSIAEIHTKDTVNRDDEAVFRLIDKSQTPVFVLGSVALSERDTVTEPRVKRCYFVALLAVLLKRDIIQNPLPEMIDKILELADGSYKLFEEPKYHTEHILKDVRLMDRLFEFRDCASQLTSLQDEKKSTDQMFFPAVKQQLKQYFKKCTSGILHFSNCCYGFWYSATTNCYYYLDPYQCDVKGRRVGNRGKSCLCVFSSITSLVKQMCLNQFAETTGFFIHRVHVELVKASLYHKFQEDPIWTYVDYHWSHRHLAKPKAKKINKKTKYPEEVVKKPSWKNYLIEVPNTIYSVWGTLSSFDVKFGPRAGKNQAAIGVALLALCDLCHPSEWSTIVLDSAVVSGDCYYKDSKKMASRCCNRFNLAKCFKVSPYLWDVEFTSDICGVLYGSTDQPSLADALKHALDRSSNLLLQCDKKILTILETTDAFYAMDSSWTGPPLFLKDRGAIYVIRCKDTMTLIYVLTKMLNTNQRLEFTITPVRMTFSQETCQSSNSKPQVSRKKILEKPARSAPGKTVDHPTLVNGSIVVPEEDSHLCYIRNLKLGLARGAEFENPPSLDEHKRTSSVISRKRQESGKRISDMKSSRKTSQIIRGFKTQLESDRAVPSILERTVDRPPVLNLLKNIEASKKQQCGSKASAVIHESQKELEFGKSSSKDVDVGYSKMIAARKHAAQFDINAKLSEDKNRFDIRSSFVQDETREMFETYNAEMKKEVRQSYKYDSSSEYKQVESPEQSQKAVEETKSTVISIVVEGMDESRIETEEMSTQEMLTKETEKERAETLEEEEEIPEEEPKFRSSLHLNIT